MSRRILHVVDSLSIGGAEKLLLELSARSIAEGHEIHVAYFTEGPLYGDFHRIGIAPVRLSRHGLRDPRAAVRLFGLIRRVRPDVVHTHLSKSDVLGQLVAAAARVPVRISTIHNVDPWRRSPIWSRAVALATAGAHRFIAVSPEVERYVRRWGGAPPERLVTIPNGVDVDRFTPGVGPDRDHPVVGAVGRLTDSKNHAMLVRSAAELSRRHPGLRVVVYGTGPRHDDLVRQIGELGVSDVVVLAGATDDIPAAMAGFDVIAFPSRFEGLPVALLEGMAMAVPAVATAVGGVPDVISDGVDGLLVPAGDEGAFTAALDRLLSDPDARGLMGAAARKTVEARYTSAGNAAAVLGLYDQVDRPGDAPLRVLSVTKSTGGLAVYNTRLVRLLTERGVEVEVVCLSEGSESYAAELEGHGVPTVAMDMSRYRVDPLGDARLAMRLSRHIRSGGFDVVIGHGSKAGFLVRLAERVTGTPAVYALASLSFVERTQGRKARLYRVLERVGRLLGGEIVTVAHSTRREVLEHRLATAETVTAIHTGIDPGSVESMDPTTARRRLGLDPNRPVVGWAARMVDQKAPAVFVEAVARLTDLDHVQFAMVGDGPLLDGVRRTAARLGVADRIRFIPWQSDIGLLYSAMDVYVLTSRWEGLPQSLLEAMAVGAVPVSTDVDGNAEVIEDGLSGILVPPDRPDLTAGAIRRLMEDSTLRSSMADEARLRVARDFTTDQMIDAWVGLLTRLGTNGSSGGNRSGEGGENDTPQSR